MIGNLTRPRLALALILLLALGLRLIALDSRNLWYDEAFSILFARQGLDAMRYGTLTPVAGGAADIHPLLYYVTLDGWMRLFGSSVFAVRMLSVLFGVATIAALYGLARTLFSPRVGLAAALITAIAPFHVQYAQEARMYSLLALLLVAATGLFARAAQGKTGWRSAAAFGVLAALAMYSQQLAAFYLLALGLLPLIQRDRRLFRWLLLGTGVALLVYAPWLIQLPAQLGKVGAYYWVQVPDVARLLLSLRVFFAGGNEPPATTALLMLGGALVVVALLAVQVGFVWRRLPRATRRSLALVLWLALVPVLGMWAVSQVQPVYLERALLPSALMLYVALGWLLTSARLPHVLAGGLALILLAVAVTGLVTHYRWDQFPNLPYRRAAETIAQNWQAGDIVVHQSKLSALPMAVYAPTLDQRFVRDLPGSPEDTLAEPTRQVLGIPALDCAEAAGAQATRIWYVTFTSLRQQAAAAGRDDIARSVAWLDTQDTDAETWRWLDLEVTRYALPDDAAHTGDCTP